MDQGLSPGSGGERQCLVYLPPHPPEHASQVAGGAERCSGLLQSVWQHPVGWTSPAA